MGSKVSYVVGQAYAVAVGLIHWFSGMNAAREVQPYLQKGKVSKETGLRGGVFESLLERGWSSELPCQGVLLPYGEHTAELAIKERKAMVAQCIDNENVELADTLKTMWCDAKGNYIVPLFAGNSGFTRGLSLPFILNEKIKRALESGDEYNPAEFLVQVVVKQFASEQDRLVEQAFENESRKMSGVSDMNWADRLKAGRALLKAAGKHGNERLLRRAFGDGNGQKTFAILTADSRFPSLKLVERIKMKAPKDFARTPEGYDPQGYIPAASIPQSAKELREADSAESAEQWLKLKVFGGSNAPKVMGKDTWSASRAAYHIEDGSPLDAIVRAHLGNEGLGAIVDKWPQLAKANCVCSLAAAITSKPVKTKTKAKA